MVEILKAWQPSKICIVCYALEFVFFDVTSPNFLGQENEVLFFCAEWQIHSQITQLFARPVLVMPFSILRTERMLITVGTVIKMGMLLKLIRCGSLTDIGIQLMILQASKDDHFNYQVHRKNWKMRTRKHRWCGTAYLILVYFALNFPFNYKLCDWEASCEILHLPS